MLSQRVVLGLSVFWFVASIAQSVRADGLQSVAECVAAGLRHSLEPDHDLSAGGTVIDAAAELAAKGITSVDIGPAWSQVSSEWFSQTQAKALARRPRCLPR